MKSNQINQGIPANYDQFMRELTMLSRLYGVAIQSVGGVILASTQGEFTQMRYVSDISSGDIYPKFAEITDN
jgi:hypothetical protein